MIKKKSYDKIMCSALWIYVRWPMAHQWGFLKWSTCEKKEKKIDFGTDDSVHLYIFKCSERSTRSVRLSSKLVDLSQ